ncbi:hypothetical protein [Paraclostridium sordellii]|uniref:hypothetical protein n=1 Tax=Paraclostridium sordellii TaxID=1505 RepID=UPI0005E592B6|nr:hypothetical protein [Paeniclostridium sordellii]CEN21270.1 Uncharacterised protein [[Clostridium] sordellii] [Paeniclostridium sordellii]
MRNFKNTIAAAIIIGIALILQGVFMSIQTTPTIIFKLGKFLFNLLNYVESIVFAFAILKDLREYFKSKW